MSRDPARVESVAVEPAGDGVIVVNPDRTRVHYLNHTAALVLDLCTGTRDIEEIVAIVQKSFDLDEPPSDDVRRCLDRLQDERLIA
jgi:hypothetical protein